MKAVFLTEEINSYGFWVKLSGLNLERYQQNPVLLYDHDDRRPAIGKVKDLRIEGNQLVGEVEFDEQDALGKELKRKYEKGYMRGFSVGIIPIKLSSEEKYLKANQKLATVIEAELLEISVVNIPSDQNAIKLYNQDSVRLSAMEISTLIPAIQKQEKMELQQLKQKLHLGEKAKEEDIISAVESLQQELDDVRKELETTKEELQAKREIVQEIILEYGRERGVINDNNQEEFKKLAASDSKLALKIIKAVKRPNVKLSDMINNEGEKQEAKTLFELSEAEVLELKSKNPPKYRELYNKTFGFYPEEV